MKKTFLTALFSLCAIICLAQSTAMIIAHRGGRAEQDENTMAAFRNAWAAGLHGYETDMRMTRDGVIVIAHDSSLLRTCGTEATIEHLTYKQLKKLRTKQGNAIPTLQEFTRFFSDKKDTYIEFEMKTQEKNLYPDSVIPVYCERIYSQIKQCMPEGATWIFSSFDERTLAYMHAHHPDAQLQYIIGKPLNAETIKRAQELGAKRIAAWLNGATRGNVNAAHKANLKINLWPCNTLQDITLALCLGADIVCTDSPIHYKQQFRAEPPIIPVRF